VKKRHLLQEALGRLKHDSLCAIAPNFVGFNLRDAIRLEHWRRERTTRARTRRITRDLPSTHSICAQQASPHIDRSISIDSLSAQATPDTSSNEQLLTHTTCLSKGTRPLCASNLPAHLHLHFHPFKWPSLLKFCFDWGSRVAVTLNSFFYTPTVPLQLILLIHSFDSEICLFPFLIYGFQIALTTSIIPQRQRRSS
jgi:hypothetical protein